MVLISSGMIRWIVIGILTLGCLSCGEDSALTERTVSFHGDNAGWLTSFEPGEHFVMTDSSRIRRSYLMIADQHTYEKSWGSFLFINTDMLHTEYRYQQFRAVFGPTFSISLTAREAPYGDELYISTGEVSFAYDLAVQLVSRVYMETESKSMLMTDTGYENNESILSGVELLDSLEVQGRVYKQVIRFTLSDFSGDLDPFTPRVISVGKGNGLIRVEFAGGNYLERE